MMVGSQEYSSKCELQRCSLARGRILDKSRHGSRIKRRTTLSSGLYRGPENPDNCQTIRQFASQMAKEETSALNLRGAKPAHLLL